MWGEGREAKVRPWRCIKLAVCWWMELLVNQRWIIPPYRWAFFSGDQLPGLLCPASIMDHGLTGEVSNLDAIWISVSFFLCASNGNWTVCAVQQAMDLIEHFQEVLWIQERPVYLKKIYLRSFVRNCFKVNMKRHLKPILMWHISYFFESNRIFNKKICEMGLDSVHPELIRSKKVVCQIWFHNDV